MSQTAEELSLYTILLGCKPKGRNVEQHDVFFGAAKNLEGLSDSIKMFWYKTVISELTGAVKKTAPSVDSTLLEKDLLSSLSRRDKVHIDAWIKVQYVDGYKINIRKKGSAKNANGDLKLYFINLGGYKENEFEEFHKKLFAVAPSVSEALGKVMKMDFMIEYSPQSLGLAGSAHLDDQFKIDFEADDIICVSETIGDEFEIELEAVSPHPENEMVVGYSHINYPA
ncbi:MAG: DUF1543 domain-containing protein [Bacteroidia bacterium]